VCVGCIYCRGAARVGCVVSVCHLTNGLQIERFAAASIESKWRSIWLVEVVEARKQGKWVRPGRSRLTDRFTRPSNPSDFVDDLATIATRSMA
jgi:hypothetical protein